MKRLLVGLSVLVNVAVLAGGGWLYLATDGFAFGRLRQERALSLQEKLPIEAGDVVFLGDSITAGGAWTELFPGVPVKNRGIGGDTSAEVLGRLDSVIAGKPAAIFLLVGTNDLARMIASAEIAANVAAIVRRIRSGSPQTTVHLQSVLPRDTLLTGAVRELNRRLEVVAREHGAEWIDLFPLFVDRDGASIRDEYSNDELHLMGPGYLVWRDVLRPYVDRAGPGRAPRSPPDRRVSLPPPDGRASRPLRDGRASSPPRDRRVSSRAPRFERVIVVLADALRSDHLGFAGYARDTSPHLDRLAGEGVVFPDVVAQSSHTVPSVTALLTGRYPGDLGIAYWPKTRGFAADARKVPPRLPADARTLAEELSDAGFETAAVVANPWLERTYGFAQGYDRYVTAVPGERKLRADGAAINQKAFAILSERRERPLFLYLHYLDTHNPYGRRHVPRRYRKARGRERYRNGRVPDLSTVDLRYTEALYDEGVRYFDGLIGALRRFLEATGQADGTLLVLVSDHGDEFYDHGGLGHGRTLHNEVVRSFAIFWSPELHAAEVDTPAEGIDILPTILRLLGREPSVEVAGRALLDEAGRPVAPPPRARFAELGSAQAVTYGGWKLIAGARGRERFYEVGEGLAVERPVESPPPAVARLLRERLAAHRAAGGRAPRPESPARAIEPSTAAALRALGYLDP